MRDATFNNSLSMRSMRDEVNGELHARPFIAVEGGQRVLHIAIPDWVSQIEAVQRLSALCAAFGSAEPDLKANHHLVLFGDTRLKWERHTEFTTYTFFRDGGGTGLFDDVFCDVLPTEWLDAAHRDAIVATRLAVERMDRSAHETISFDRQFVSSPLVGSTVLGGGAEAWTDFRINGDGYSRILLVDLGLREQQGGRLVQRLLEIETYMMMALLGLPHARFATSELSPLEDDLVRITAAFSEGEDTRTDQALLAALSRIAGRLEWLLSRNSYRFSASRAYHALVEQRLAELREVRIEGYVTFTEYVARRVKPPMDFCASVMQREQDLSRRLARAGQLLRARVDVALEEQSRQLLSSMDQRSEMQLRLHEVVELFSLIAILYYAVNLISILLSELMKLGVPVDKSLFMIMAVPILLVSFLISMWRLRRGLRRSASSARPNKK